MANAADARFTRVTIALAIIATALALWAAAGAIRVRRESWHGRIDRSMPRPIDSSPTVLDRRLEPFWIGAWCPPPVRATTAEAWARFADAGIDVGISPLEDKFRREDNLARLALLDSLNAARASASPPQRPIFTVVRDDSLHPDETLRPGWEGRLARMRRLYGAHPSCVGIFVADEPRAKLIPVYAPLARAMVEDAYELPVPFVNYIGLNARPTIADRPRWRADMKAALDSTRLPFFTYNAYAATDPGGEWPNFLLTLEDAARVAWETGTRFGMLVQVTGHEAFKPATPGQARMRVFEALAHGATAIVWFTYWTPNPNEEPLRWHDGLVDYATGRPTAQYAMVRTVNDQARLCAAWWSAAMGETGVAHLGGGLPPGADALAASAASIVPGLLRTKGGPLTIGFLGESDGRRKLLVINRDTERARTFELELDANATTMVKPVKFDDASQFSWGGASVSVLLPPGGAIGLELTVDPGARTTRRP